MSAIATVAIADSVRSYEYGFHYLGRHMRHALMENRSGLMVDVGTTHATGTAEREAARVRFLASKEWIVRLWDGLYNGPL